MPPTGPPLSVRSATPDDASAVTALLMAQLREHAIDTPEVQVARTVANLLERPTRGRFLLALDGETPIGVAALSLVTAIEHGGSSAWLEELYVVPARRNQGVGGRLLAAACAVVTEAGGAAVDLEVEAGHARAARLYERAGFRPMTRSRWVRRLPRTGPTPSARPGEATGGCFCGAVRYRVSAPPEVISQCHCAMCRKIVGAPVVTWVTYPRAAYTVTTGAPRELVSSPAVVRTFCAECGTSLTFRETARPDLVDVTVASLDDPAAFPPDEHIWTSSALPWLALDDDLPRRPGN